MNLPRYGNILALILFISLVYASDIPKVINYQGKLTDPSGVGVDDTVAIIFRIYDAPTGGLILWTEAHPLVPVENGLFEVMLGGTFPINLPFDRAYYLEMEINGETLSPRVQFLTVPYAFRAIYVDSADYAVYSDTANWTIYADTAVFSVIADTSSYAYFADSARVATVNWDTLAYYAELGTLAFYAPIETLGAYSDTTHTHSLGDLVDVDTSGVAVGQVLKWDGTEWRPAMDDTGGGSSSGMLDSAYIWNQDTIEQNGNLWISGTATVGTLAAEDIKGQGYIAMDYSGAPIPVNDSSFTVLFTSSYNAAGPGSGVMISFTGTFDDRNGKNGSGMEVQLVRNPGAGETVLTSQKTVIANYDVYSDNTVTLTAMDFPPAGMHTYAVRARMVYPPLDAGRFVMGSMQIVEIKK